MTGRRVFLMALSLSLGATSLDVPFVRQVKAGCGSAAVAMVMQYWVREQPGLDSTATDAERIHRQLPSSSRGIHGTALRRYLETHGFDAFIFDGELADLRNHVAKGRPVVVCLGLSGPKGPLHYVVVTSIDANRVTLNDPARGKLITEELDAFARAWKVTDNWSMLAVPRQKK